MNNELRDRIAELLIAHPSGLRAVGDPPDWPWAVADAILALPGIAVVELPGPDDGRDDWLDATVRTGLSKGCPRSVDVELDPGAVIGLSVEYARDLAAALLAAAEYAEREQ